MKSISLLPPEIRRRHKAKEQRMMYIVLIFALLVLFAGAYSVLYITIFNAQDELSIVKNHRTMLETEMLALDDYSFLLAGAAKIEKMFDDVMKKTPDWECVLGGIGESMPNGVWLTAIDATVGGGGKDEKSKSGGVLVIKGWAENDHALARWLPEVKKIDGLENVKCEFFSNREYQGMLAYQFEIRADVRPGKFNLLPGKE